MSGRRFLFPLAISLSDIVSRERENNTGPITELQELVPKLVPHPAGNWLNLLMEQKGLDWLWMCLCSRKRKSDRQTAVSHLLIEWWLSDLNVPWGSFLFDTDFQILFLKLSLSKIFSLLKHPSWKPCRTHCLDFMEKCTMYVGLGSLSRYSVLLLPGFQTDADSALCHHQLHQFFSTNYVNHR